MNSRMVKNSIDMLSDCQIAKWAKSTSGYLHFLTDKKCYFNSLSMEDILFSATLPVHKSKSIVTVYLEIQLSSPGYIPKTLK